MSGIGYRDPAVGYIGSASSQPFGLILDQLRAAPGLVVDGELGHDEAIDEEGSSRRLEIPAFVDFQEGLAKPVHFLLLQWRGGDQGRHRGRIGRGDDSHLRGEGRVARADEVPDVAVERPYVDLSLCERLDDAARVHETADDLAVLRLRVLRLQVVAEGEVARLRVLERVAD